VSLFGGKAQPREEGIVDDETALEQSVIVIACER
jgi:hypothetical protein